MTWYHSGVLSGAHYMLSDIMVNNVD